MSVVSPVVAATQLVLVQSTYAVVPVAEPVGDCAACLAFVPVDFVETIPAP